jgi:hypothetical protein
MVLCLQNGSYKKNELVIEKSFWNSRGWEFTQILRSLEQFIHKLNGQSNFWNGIIF